MYYYPDDPKAPCSLNDVVASGVKRLTLDISTGLHLIDGQRAHGVAPFEGERYSIVWYTQSNFECPTGEQLEALRFAGFCPPTWRSLNKLTKCRGTEQFRRWTLAKTPEEGLLFSAESVGKSF